MKSKLLFISCIINIGFCFFVLSAFKNGDTVNSTEKYFIAEYTTGKMWDKKLDFHQQTFAMSHSRFLSSLRDQGVITLGGRYADKGVIILTSTDLPTATNLLKSDTAVIHHLFDVEINEIAFFYKGCIPSLKLKPERKHNDEMNESDETENDGTSPKKRYE